MLAPTTRVWRLNVVKSLFAFGCRVGYVRFDVTRAVKAPAVWIMCMPPLVRMLATEGDPRNHALLTLLYAAGLRVSEACGLGGATRNLRDVGGLVTIFGRLEHPGFTVAAERLGRIFAANPPRAARLLAHRRRGQLPNCFWNWGG